MRTPQVLAARARDRGRRVPARDLASRAAGRRRRASRVGKGYEPVPRAAIGADGTSALAFRSKSGKLMLSTGTPERALQRAARDRPARARATGRSPRVPAVASSSCGRTRTGSAPPCARAPRPRLRASRRASNGEEINGVQVAADPGRLGRRRAPVPPLEQGRRRVLRTRDDAHAGRRAAGSRPGSRPRRLRHRRAPDAVAGGQRHRPRRARVQPRPHVPGRRAADRCRLRPPARRRVHRAGRARQASPPAIRASRPRAARRSSRPRRSAAAATRASSATPSSRGRAGAGRSRRSARRSQGPARVRCRAWR